MTSSPESEVFLAFNHTELYQICRRGGMNVHPSATREEMASYLCGDAPPPPAYPEHAVDDWRQAIMAFLADHWQVVRSQVQCPAKNLMNDALGPGEKRACDNCTDARVLACVASNPDNEHMIQLRRKGTT